MQPKSSQSWPIAAAIVIGALMICATLVVLNLRTTYPLITNGQPMSAETFTKLMSSGCTLLTTPDTGGRFGLSCPLWVRP